MNIKECDRSYSRVPWNEDDLKKIITQCHLCHFRVMFMAISSYLCRLSTFTLHICDVCVIFFSIFLICTHWVLIPKFMPLLGTVDSGMGMVITPWRTLGGDEINTQGFCLQLVNVETPVQGLVSGRQRKIYNRPLSRPHLDAFYDIQGEGSPLLPRSSMGTLHPEARHTFVPFGALEEKETQGDAQGEAHGCDSLISFILMIHTTELYSCCVNFIQNLLCFSSSMTRTSHFEQFKTEPSPFSWNWEWKP